MSRPLVALACADEVIGGVPYAAVRRAYISAIEEIADCAVALVSGPAPYLAGIMDRFDGLVLGGHQSNISPGRYGGSPCPGPYDIDRDALALSVLPAAVRSGLPVFGICRGIQEMNVAFGGTLQDLGMLPAGPNHREDLALTREEQYQPRHDVRLTPGGVLHGLANRDVIRVNSLHRQAVSALAPGLACEAVTSDGVVEAVSVRGSATFCVGVQWHPEWYAGSDWFCRRLFAAFGEAAAHNATSRGPAEARSRV